MNPTSIHEDSGLIPSLAQWVTDLAWLWLWRRPGTYICLKKKVLFFRSDCCHLPSREQIFFCFLELHPQYMGVPRLRVDSELQLPAYTTATATWDPSDVCDLHHSSGQRQILKPPIEARDRTQNLMVPSWICFRHDGNSLGCTS